MPPTINEFYATLAAAAQKVRDEATKDAARFGKAHTHIESLFAWKKLLEARPEAALLAQVCSELHLCLFAMSSGLYRLAFASLRLALELTVGIVWFSTHRLDLAEWQVGTFDLRWKELIDSEKGVLSPRYTKAFFPDLRDDVRRYQGTSAKLYRELSEQVHGNALTQELSPDKIVFSADAQEKLFQQIDTFISCAHMMLSLRYLQELPPEQRKVLEAPLLDILGTINAIRDIFAA